MEIMINYMYRAPGASPDNDTRIFRETVNVEDPNEVNALYMPRQPITLRDEEYVVFDRHLILQWTQGHGFTVQSLKVIVTDPDATPA